MSARDNRRKELRRQRLEAEEAEGAAATKRRKVQLLAIGVLALVLVAAVIAISQLGTDEGTDPSASAAQSEETLASIPQDGTVLGEPDAPYTLTEFGDLQCPFCRTFSLEVMPEVIDEYVRAGELKIDFQPLTFIGPDSEEAARMALAVGEQGKYWQFVDLFYANQGAENSGYVDDEFLREIAGEIEGVDVDEALAARDSESITAALTSSAALAGDLGVNSTPSFAIAAEGEDPAPLGIQSLDAAEFTSAIDQFIGERS